MMFDPAILPVWCLRERFECSMKIESGNVNWAQSNLCLYMVLRVPMLGCRHDRLCSGDAIGQGCGMSCKSYMPRRTNSMWSSQDAQDTRFLRLAFHYSCSSGRYMHDRRTSELHDQLHSRMHCELG
jgi:hypothetical protein